jgi:hypothetical protein
MEHVLRVVTWSIPCDNNMFDETGTFSSHEKVSTKFGDHGSLAEGRSERSFTCHSKSKSMAPMIIYSCS